MRRLPIWHVLKQYQRAVLVEDSGRIHSSRTLEDSWLICDSKGKHRYTNADAFVWHDNTMLHESTREALCGCVGYTHCSLRLSRDNTSTIILLRASSSRCMLSSPLGIARRLLMQGSVKGECMRSIEIVSRITRNTHTTEFSEYLSSAR